MQNVSLWGPDGKYHSVVPVFNGAIGPVPVDKTASPENQTFMVEGDPVGSSFTAIATNENFKDQPGRFANMYNGYLENAFNNFLVDLNKPHGPDQRVWRWDDAGIGGGYYTATNGLSVRFLLSFFHFLFDLLLLYVVCVCAPRGCRFESSSSTFFEPQLPR